MEQIKENILWFGEFISYFNDEKETGENDLSKIKFLRDDIVLVYALRTIRALFGAPEKIP